MSFDPPMVAVVGATGAVGAELIACLQARRFPLAQLRLFASARSSGRKLSFNGEHLPVEALDAGSLKGAALNAVQIAEKLTQH